MGPDSLEEYAIQRPSGENFASVSIAGVARRGSGVPGLDSDLALQLGVACAIHLAHAACADGREDLVDSDKRARFDGHGI